MTHGLVYTSRGKGLKESGITKHVFMETTQLRLYALLRDQKDGNEYELCVRIQEEKVNVKNEPSVKDEISV